jgi:hypothetical protein
MTLEFSSVFLGRVLRVQHENAIGDLEGQIHRIEDYCGLQFEQNLVDFHDTEQVLRTSRPDKGWQQIYESTTQPLEIHTEFLSPLVMSLGGSRDTHHE